MENNSNSQLIDQALSDRCKLLQNSVDKTLDLITERKDIQKIVLSNINNEILRARNIILENQLHSSYQQVPTNPIVFDMNREIFRLERDKINEDITSWRDILTLERTLIQLVNELSSAKNKISLLKNNNSQS